jgi:hypothetical protein
MRIGKQRGERSWMRLLVKHNDIAFIRGHRRCAKRMIVVFLP